jgi:predicted esterase
LKHFTQSFKNEASVYRIDAENCDKLIYVLHGYGQLAKYFIQKFKPLLAQGFTVIAPEGLHRFYLQGTSGRVGASWMTKENRELDIANYITYLNALHEEIAQEKKWKQVIVLGFSQGVATAFRWIAEGQINPDQFLLCSGMIPPDVNLEESNSKFSAIEMTYFSGTNDPYKTEEAVTHFQQRITQLPFPIKMVEFEGVHEVNMEAVLAEI